MSVLNLVDIIYAKDVEGDNDGNVCAAQRVKDFPLQSVATGCLNSVAEELETCPWHGEQ